MVAPKSAQEWELVLAAVEEAAAQVAALGTPHDWRPAAALRLVE